MLVTVFILTIATSLTNGYPATNSEYQDSELQQFVQEPVNQDYFEFDDSISKTHVDQTAGFTITCAGANKICTSRNQCLNGYVQASESISYKLLNKQEECSIHDEVCCTIVEVHGAASDIENSELKFQHNGNVGFQVDELSTNHDQNVENTAFGSLNSPSFAKGTFPTPTHVQLGCAAALVCVEDKFCTMDGTISTEPVLLTEKQLLRRVPLSNCKNPENGIIGKCCRDPNYVDPWPTENLPANYSGGFDEQGFPTFLNIAKVKPPKVPVIVTPSVSTTTTNQPLPFTSVTTEAKVEPSLILENTIPFPEVLEPPKEEIVSEGQSNAAQGVNLQCGVRHKALREPGVEESVTVFGEIPWQAMVLNAQEKKIICSGALLDVYNVLTAASCIDNLQPDQILVKLGEWKLAYEVEEEEPLPFKIHNVAAIDLHPHYTKGLGSYDLALIRLQTPAALDFHVNPLCLPERKYSENRNRSCIATGWGKSILQAHYAGAIMHAVNLNILSNGECKNHLIETELEANISEDILCATTKEQKNNICEADFGGPLACENEHGYYALTGIYSQDTGCLSTNQVAVFASLDDKWIKEKMYNTDSIPQANTSEEYDLTNDYSGSTLIANNQYLPPH